MSGYGDVQVGEESFRRLYYNLGREHNGGYVTGWAKSISRSGWAGVQNVRGRPRPPRVNGLPQVMSACFAKMRTICNVLCVPDAWFAIGLTKRQIDVLTEVHLFSAPWRWWETGSQLWNAGAVSTLASIWVPYRSKTSSVFSVLRVSTSSGSVERFGGLVVASPISPESEPSSLSGGEASPKPMS